MCGDQGNLSANEAAEQLPLVIFFRYALTCVEHQRMVRNNQVCAELLCFLNYARCAVQRYVNARDFLRHASGEQTGIVEV